MKLALKSPQAGPREVLVVFSALVIVEQVECAQRLVLALLKSLIFGLLEPHHFVEAGRLRSHRVLEAEHWFLDLFSHVPEILALASLVLPLTRFVGLLVLLGRGLSCR